MGALRFFLSIFSISLFSCASASAPNVPSYFEIHGHRGAMARRPENTISAFRYALSVGVKTLELDLGISKDMKVVVNHDFEVNTDYCVPKNPKLVNVVKPLIHSLTLKEIQSYDCGSIKKKGRRRAPAEPSPACRCSASPAAPRRRRAASRCRTRARRRTRSLPTSTPPWWCRAVGRSRPASRRRGGAL